MKKRIAALCVVLCAALGVAACGGGSSTGNTSQQDQAKVNQTLKRRGHAYVPYNNVEFGNYNAAQKLYDTPNTIIWCSTTWGNPSAPIVTVPIAGKLTSSSVSYFPGSHVDYDSSGNTLVESRSVDGMYHGNPPPYRYGFTPGGQYVDFFNMPTVCTTALTKFQRQATKVSLSVDPGVAKAQAAAEQALAKGEKQQAQALLESALNGQ